MKNVLKNWRTSLVGGGALTAGIVQFAETGDFQASLPTLLLGLLGLLSKDHNVTHSNCNCTKPKSE